MLTGTWLGYQSASASRLGPAEMEKDLLTLVQVCSLAVAAIYLRSSITRTS
jgi:hypothetical protein